MSEVIVSGCEQWYFCENVDVKCAGCFRNTTQDESLPDLFEVNERGRESGYRLKWTKEEWIKVHSKKPEWVRVKPEKLDRLKNWIKTDPQSYNLRGSVTKRSLALWKLVGEEILETFKGG